MSVLRLGREHEASTEQLLLQDVEANLFLLGFLDAHPIERMWWYGVVQGDRVQAVVMLLPGRLAVPWCPDPAHAALLGHMLRARHPPCMMVGPRQATDALWAVWAPEVALRRRYDQRLYACTTPPRGTRVAGFRPARPHELEQLAVNAGLMEEEDLGRNPMRVNPRQHRQVVADRIGARRTWVIVRDRAVVFQINVGTITHWGVQVGGTYVPPQFRGRGYAKAGMLALVRELLRVHPRITLHVNEANAAAVRVYESSGFKRSCAFRLLTLQ